MPSSTPKAHIQARVHQVAQMFAAGALPGDVKRAIIDQWQIKPRTADDYISRAKKLIEESLADERPQYAARLIATLHRILRESMATKNYSCALGATAQLARITGLDRGGR